MCQTTHVAHWCQCLPGAKFLPEKVRLMACMIWHGSIVWIWFGRSGDVTFRFVCWLSQGLGWVRWVWITWTCLQMGLDHDELGLRSTSETDWVLHGGMGKLIDVFSRLKYLFSVLAVGSCIATMSGRWSLCVCVSWLLFIIMFTYSCCIPETMIRTACCLLLHPGKKWLFIMFTCLHWWLIINFTGSHCLFTIVSTVFDWFFYPCYSCSLLWRFVSFVLPGFRSCREKRPKLMSQKSSWTRQNGRCGDVVPEMRQCLSTLDKYCWGNFVYMCCLLWC